MNINSSFDFNNSQIFPVETVEPSDKLEMSREFSALLTAFCAPPQIPLAFAPSSADELAEQIVLESNTADDIMAFSHPVSKTNEFFFLETPISQKTSDQTDIKLSVKPKELESVFLSEDAFSQIDIPHQKTNEPMLMAAKDTPSNQAEKTHFDGVAQRLLAKAVIVVQSQSGKSGLSIRPNLVETSIFSIPQPDEQNQSPKSFESLQKSDQLPEIFRAIVKPPNENFAKSDFVRTISDEHAENTFAKPAHKIDDNNFFETFTNVNKSSVQPSNFTVKELTADRFELHLQNNLGEQINQALTDLAAKISVLHQPQIIKLRLRPAELGTVEIKLEETKSGKINASLITQTEATCQILTENISELRSALQQAGWQVENLEISHNSFLNHDSNRNPNHSQSTLSEQGREETVCDSAQSQTENNSQTEIPVSPPQNRLLSVRA